MKKFFAVLMALVLVLSMGVTVFAAGETGSITINNAVDGATYSIYKMFDFAAIDGNADKGRYTVVAAWEDFLKGDGAAYLKADDATGSIVWVDAETDVRKAELAKKAIAYAKAKGITADESLPADASGVVTFTDVPLGYYAIDTSLGAICALTNVNNKFEAHEKNSAPTIDKLVQEDSDKKWGAANSASIGDTVNYKSTITVGKGAQHYIVHDSMEDGLTFTEGSIVITWVKAAGGETTVANASYTVTTAGLQDGCDFEIDFTDTFEAGLSQGDKLVITYSAVLNENAEIYSETNDNTIYLQYGETFRTDVFTTKTTTFKFDLVKTDENDKIIDGAEFKLFSNSEAGKKAQVLLVKNDDGTYRVAVTAEEKANAADTVIVAGIVTIYGLDSDKETTYYLQETKAPNGYNKVNDDIDIVLGTGSGDSFAANNLIAKTELREGVKYYTEGGVEVENKTGGLLPETGGIGTTIFYIVGITLMLGAAILLISKKKMAAKA